MYHRNSNYVLKFINLSVSNKPRKLIHFGKQIKIKIREFHAKQLIKILLLQLTWLLNINFVPH